MRKTIVALGLAALWSIALLVAAAVVPVYQSSSASSSTSASSPAGATDQHAIATSSSATLVEENGSGVLGVVGMPLLAVVVVSTSLWRRHAHGKGGPGPVAWIVVGLLSALTAVAMLSIGIFMVPVTGLLVVACLLELAPTSRGGAAPRRVVRGAA